MHGRHAQGSQHPLGPFPKHVAGNSVGKVGAKLGRLRADLDLGPKSQVEARELLYTFHLRTMVIRSLDEEIINSKDATVSKITRVKPWSIGAPNTWSYLVKLNATFS
jgi:hypothetical protein